MARTIRRWVLRVLVGLLGLAVLLAVVLLLALAHLDFAPVKGIVRAQVRKQGLDVDFDRAGVTLGSIEVRNLRLASPPADRARVPDLVQIGSIDGRWSPFRKRIDELVVRDVTVRVVADDDGTTSIDRLLAGLPPSPAAPPVPLSRRLEGLLPAGLTAHVRVENLVVEVIPSGAGKPLRLTGLVASGDLEGGNLALHVGPAALRLDAGDHSALARLDGTVELAPTGRTRIALALELERQDLAPELPPVRQVVKLAMTSEPDAAQHRTHVVVETLALLDGALQVAADADVLDGEGGAMRAVVHTASCRIDAAALARAVPAAVGPVVVEAEPLVCSAHELTLGPAIAGELQVTGRIEHAAARGVDLRGAKLDVTATPQGLKLHLPIDGVTMPGLAAAGLEASVTATPTGTGFPVAFQAEVAAASVDTETARVRGARVHAQGTARSASDLDAHAILDADSVEGPAAVRTAHLVVDARGVGSGTKGHVKLEGSLASVAHPSGRATDVTFAGGVDLPSARLTVDAGRLEAAQLPPGPAHVEVDASRVVLDPLGGDARLLATFAGGTVSGTVSAAGRDLTWDLDGKADRVGPAQAIALKSKGSYGATIAQDTTVEVGRVNAGKTALRAAHLHLVTTGTLRHLEGQLTAGLDGLTVGGAPAGSPRLEVTAKADLDASRLDATLRGRGPDVDLHLVAALDKARTLTWSLDGRVSDLQAVAALLPAGPDWSRARIEVRGRGSVAGVVRAVVGGVPVLASDPLAAARGRQELHLAAGKLRYAGAAETSADLGGLTLDASADLGDPRRGVVDLAVPDLAAVASGVHVAVEGLTMHADVTRPRHGDGKIVLTVRAKSLKQSAFPSYAVRDLDLAVDATGDPDAAMTIHGRLANPGAGTFFEATGKLDRRVVPAADAVPQRNSVSIEGKLEQTLDKLDGAPELLRARGRLTVPFRVESGDLSLFDASARIQLEDVDVELPQRQLRVAGVRGSVPITEELVIAPSGTRLVGHGEVGPYPEHRYLDEQPFLDVENYLSIAEVDVGGKKLGPVAGNARVDRDVVALDQLELTALGGKIAGQFQALLRGRDTSVAFRGKVTGLRVSSADEVLDANAAVTLRPYRLGLDGRIEIVRIGRDHLLDLLDLTDPYHADVATNRVRLALKLGYPKRVRLHFAQGFASLAIELGGLVGVVRIDEIVGVPIGPALERWLAPVLERP